jgi:3-methylcrotonyl-CoA carboxylase alpha subunit
MRVVENAEGFDAALAACRREAKASFGDDAMLIEKYLARSRHIEIQVFADAHGNFMHLAERDCSLQRRHQKVVEEAPAPLFDERRRQAMSEAAIAAAKAVGYVGAGTVEFIAAPSGEFYFMEMNTRLQVEHPVTEMITGLDLVEWQLRVAAGQPLPMRQEDLDLQGHAMEVRIYAERPDKGFLPSTGTLAAFELPAEAQFWVDKPATRPLTRADSGFRAGDTVTPFYDAMLAKLVVHGRDRAEAIERMLAALRSVKAEGVHTNVAFLVNALSSEAFRSGEVDTGLIGRHPQFAKPATA